MSIHHAGIVASIQDHFQSMGVKKPGPDKYH